MSTLTDALHMQGAIIIDTDAGLNTLLLGVQVLLAGKPPGVLCPRATVDMPTSGVLAVVAGLLVGVAGLLASLGRGLFPLTLGGLSNGQHAPAWWPTIDCQRHPCALSNLTENEFCSFQAFASILLGSNRYAKYTTHSLIAVSFESMKQAVQIARPPDPRPVTSDVERHVRA